MTYNLCQGNSCDCESGCDCDAYDALEYKLMQMTHWAHKSVLFETIKDHIRKTEGAKLEKLAELLVEASKEKWKTEQEASRKEQELREKIRETFED